MDASGGMHRILRAWVEDQEAFGVEDLPAGELGRNPAETAATEEPALGAPLAAVGYALCLLRLLDSRHRDAVLACFVPVGRMALTAYVLHGAVFTLVYMPFGLDLLGILGPAASFALALALYAALTRFAQLWLARYRFGPLEYLWRWATYGVRPPLHLVNRGAGS